MLNLLKQFTQKDSSSGLVLMLATLLALIFSNSPLSAAYHILVGETAHIIINDGLMAIFFLAVGLEIKKEILLGDLSHIKKAMLPVVAALGGVIAPALIFWFINFSNPENLRGWAVPVATDIAFALGVLTLLGNRVPRALKVLLLSLAIIDDLVAILIIALFYAQGIQVNYLLMAGVLYALAISMNRMGLKLLLPYMILGALLWVCVFQSGIHATLAGVLLAFAIPIARSEDEKSPLHMLEHILTPWVAFFIMPVFAFANAGLDLSGISFSDFGDALPLGIIMGLFFGKQLGVFLAIFFSVKFKLCHKPDRITWGQLYGLSILCGIGFTMSLFIGTLAFEIDVHLLDKMRLGVLCGSLLSAIAGYILLNYLLQGDEKNLAKGAEKD